MPLNPIDWCAPRAIPTPMKWKQDVTSQHKILYLYSIKRFLYIGSALKKMFIRKKSLQWGIIIIRMLFWLLQWTYRIRFIYFLKLFSRSKAIRRKARSRTYKNAWWQLIVIIIWEPLSLQLDSCRTKVQLGDLRKHPSSYIHFKGVKRLQLSMKMNYGPYPQT